MKRYNALESSYGKHTVKYTLQCGTYRGSFTIPVRGYRKGAAAMSTDIFETLDESDLERMEFDHLRLRFDEEGLIIEFLNDDGEVAMAVDQYWFDIDRDRLIVGIEIVEFEEDSKEKKGQTRADITKMGIATNEKVDIVRHPAHYTMGTIEPKDFIRDQGLNFNRGNVIKYTVR